jgi:hypothetical protein
MYLADPAPNLRQWDITVALFRSRLTEASGKPATG